MALLGIIPVPIQQKVNRLGGTTGGKGNDVFYLLFGSRSLWAPFSTAIVNASPLLTAIYSPLYSRHLEDPIAIYYIPKPSSTSQSTVTPIVTASSSASPTETPPGLIVLSEGESPPQRSKAVRIGAGVGAGIGIPLAIIIAVVLWRRRKSQHLAKLEEASEQPKITSGDPEKPGPAANDEPGDSKAEKEPPLELDGQQAPAIVPELEGSPEQTYELP
ncbi:hypothetical protein FQN55_000100 [Onygenales sp. PD_40]|nr:hypothetical protein FQN55_000100 [Onygenales sp. PD_40]KAK2783245.1 hypothetical protein FQN52_000346 [Onygenales sp. PD_12]